MKANLHTHSIYSDGEETPERIVELAKEEGVELLALTDHNTFDGYPRFERACQDIGLNYIKGVEIDCVQHEIGFHQELLAYFPNGGEECLEDILSRKQKARKERVLRAIQRASKQFDVDISIADFEQLAIKEKGFVGFLSNKMLYSLITKKRDGLPSYQEVQKEPYWKAIWERDGDDNNDTLYELIPLISQNNGFPVLAHFGFHFDTNIKKMQELRDEYIEHLHYMKTLGLWGIELHPYRYYPQRDKINEIIKEWAEAVNLNLTTGSDFHGGSLSTHKIFEWYGIDFKGFNYGVSPKIG